MNHNVNPALEHLLVPIEQLRHLPGNPRKGDVASIVESYKTFGQVRPVVAVPSDEEEGAFIVIAGNHQLDACIELGWTHMAVLVEEDWDKGKALAFALADNRTSELGKTDDDLLFEMLSQVDESHEELLEALQWDPFEMALLEATYESSQVETPLGQGWSPPTIVAPTEKEREDETLEADAQTTADVVTQGAEVVSRAGSERQSFNYTLVFPDIALQKRFFDFLRYLKGNVNPELTTGEQLIQFLENNHEF